MTSKTKTKTKDFLSFWDVPDGGIEALIRRAEELRALRAAGTAHPTRPGRVLGMVFEKASTRTRASFEIAMFELGGHALYLGMQGSQLERGEPLRDTARVLSGYCHAIMLRTFGHERVDEMARYAAVPVINGLTDLQHPCQILVTLGEFIDCLKSLAMRIQNRHVGAQIQAKNLQRAANRVEFIGDQRQDRPFDAVLPQIVAIGSRRFTA